MSCFRDYVFYYFTIESISKPRRKKKKKENLGKRQRATFESKIFLYNHS